MKRVRIFVSYSGDVGAEKEKAREIFERLKIDFSGRLEINDYYWEHDAVFRFHADYQSQIEPPSKFDVFVCFLWGRLGNRLHPGIHRKPGGGAYASGTEYEVLDALAAHQRSGAPQVFVFRRKTDPPPPPFKDKKARKKFFEQYDALQEFVARIAKEGEFFVRGSNSYENLEQFEEKFETHMRKVLEEFLSDAELRLRHVSKNWKEGNPFRGLRFFDFEHAPIFFGRTLAIEEVLTALKQQAAEERAFVLVFGGSGVGKSSLVRAGVLPLLVRPGAGVIEGIGVWRRAIMRPSEVDKGDLFDALAAALMRPEGLPEIGSDGTSVAKLAAKLREKPDGVDMLIKGALSQAAQKVQLEKRLEEQPRARFALVIDQLEELFTVERLASQRDGFLRAIDALARSGYVWVIATLRSDFYSRCEESPILMELKKGAGQYHLQPPSEIQLGQMIRMPAAAAGLEFEKNDKTGERLEDFLRDAAVKNPGALPLLEFALEELYEHRDKEKGLLTIDAYRRLGGVEGALAKRANESFKSCGTHAQESFDIVFHQLVTISTAEGEPAVRRRARKEKIEHTDGAKDLVKQLTADRLLFADRSEDGAIVATISHEALLTHWPRLASWVETNRGFLKIRSRVETEADEWNKASDEKKSGYLLPDGLRLAEAKDWLSHYSGEIGETEKEFIRKSIDAAEAEKKAELARLRKKNLILAATAAIALLLGGIAAVFGGLARKVNVSLTDERNQAKRNQAQLLVAAANDQFTDDRRRPALALLTEALLLNPAHHLARASLLNHLVYDKLAPATNRFQIPIGNVHITFTEDGKLAFVWAGSTGRLFDTQTSKQVGEDLLQGFPIDDAHFLQNGRILLTHGGKAGEGFVQYGGFMYWDLSSTPARANYRKVAGYLALDEKRGRAMVIDDTEVGPVVVEYPYMDIGSSTGKRIPAWSFGDRPARQSGNVQGPYDPNGDWDVSPTGAWAIWSQKLLRYPSDKPVYGSVSCHAFSAKGDKCVLIDENRHALLIFEPGREKNPFSYNFSGGAWGYKRVSCNAQANIVAAQDNGQEVHIWHVKDTATMFPIGSVHVGSRSWYLADNLCIYSWEGGLLFQCDFSVADSARQAGDNSPELSSQLIYDGPEISTVASVPNNSEKVAVLLKSGVAAFFPKHIPTGRASTIAQHVGNLQGQGGVTFDTEGNRFVIFGKGSWVLCDAISGKELARGRPSATLPDELQLSRHGDYVLTRDGLWHYDHATSALSVQPPPRGSAGYAEWSFSEEDSRLLLKQEGEGKTVYAAYDQPDLNGSLHAVIQQRTDTAGIESQSLKQYSAWNRSGRSVAVAQRDGSITVLSGIDRDPSWQAPQAIKSQLQGKEFAGLLFANDHTLVLSEETSLGSTKDEMAVSNPEGSETERNVSEIFLIDINTNTLKTSTIPERVAEMTRLSDSLLAISGERNIYIVKLPQLSIVGSLDDKGGIRLEKIGDEDVLSINGSHGVAIYDPETQLSLANVEFEQFGVTASSTAQDAQKIALATNSGDLLRYDLAPMGSEEITSTFREFIEAYLGMSIENQKPKDILLSKEKLQEIGMRVQRDPPSVYKDVALWLLEDPDKRAPNPYTR